LSQAGATYPTHLIRGRTSPLAVSIFYLQSYLPLGPILYRAGASISKEILRSDAPAYLTDQLRKASSLAHNVIEAPGGRLYNLVKVRGNKRGWGYGINREAGSFQLGNDLIGGELCYFAPIRVRLF
jgi:hypothetical protein